MFRPKRLLSILIVEGNFFILREIEAHIARQFDREVQVLKARTFKESEDIIKRGLFDIAIIELLLPDGHGDDLISLIRQKHPCLPIIVQIIEEDKAYHRVHNKHENIIYLEKEVMFLELKDRIRKAKNRHEAIASWRLPIVNYKKIEPVDINEVCYVSKVSESANLHVELYDLNKKDYTYTTIEAMTLTEFINKYNETGYFLRCHNSYIVNRKMIKSFSQVDNQITMLMPRKDGNDVIIDVSEKYKKQVREVLRGLY